ncbi:unnamed protein product [Lactuca virosa]|uniref:Uncharacterized protein n=1 Tax=Lactuca virosa TaxID=75947 RepID=A0AAU9LMJ1_9ASTR|nr:unnamed protein product [Lactuca virosa]
MMEGQNLVADSQISDRVQPIGDGSKVVGGMSDVIEGVAGGGAKVELGNGGGGGAVSKKKRGRPPKGMVKPPPAKKNKEVEEEEDVCFICFDGGSLVLCDRRGCPKAYHPACIKRDEAFFESAAKWNCGWHICSICEKTAHHMCYTCTYSLCRSCIRKSDYVCVRGDKGFCTICMKTIMLIENNGQGEDGKVYWVYLKGKLSLTLEELTQAKNPWKISTTISTIPSPLPSTTITPPPLPPLPPPPTAAAAAAAAPPPPTTTTTTTSTSTSFDNPEENESKRRKIEDHIHISITPPHKESVITEKPLIKKDELGSKDWATKELLDFVSHMKNGNTSVLSRIDVQSLLMEYIKRNNLRDPKKKNQIICDSRLKNLFGKPRVGHIEMLTHLEYHFFIEEDLCKISVNNSVNTTAILDDPDWTNENVVVVKEKKRRRRSKGVEMERGSQNKLDEFGAIDVHNMNLIYIRRDLMVKLLEDTGSFHGKVVGSIVRIRVSGSDQKNDMYRLVKVVGTSKVEVMYKIDGKLTDFMLEEECRRLQQSIRCGLVKHFTVGEIQDKAIALQSVRLDDWMEKEILRLNHLQKLQLLKTLDEREHRLQEIPEVHSDPKMNPDYESDDTEEYFNKEHGDDMESKYCGVKSSRSPKKRAGSSNDANGRTKKNEQLKNLNVSNDEEGGNTKEGNTKDTPGLGKTEYEIECNGSTITKLSSSVSNSVQETTTIPSSSIPIKNNTFCLNETLWHYLDPNGKVQGPFSIIQLQKWSTTGYFPVDMRVWANHEDKSVLLNDLLKEQFENHDHENENGNGNEIPGDKDCNQTVASEIPTPIPVPVLSPSSDVSVIPSSAPVSVNHEKFSDGSSGHGQNWNGNNNLKFNMTGVVSLTMSNESTGNLNSGDAPRETETEMETEQVPTSSKDPETPVFEVPGPIPEKVIDEEKKIESAPESKIPIPDSGNPPSWSSASSLVVGGAKLAAETDGWGVKREEWESMKPVEVAGDHVATPTSNIDQNIDQNIDRNIDQNAHPSQPGNDLPTWHGMAEMIEFSTLAEESVSDLLAEVDAMESQYGLPSPTSRRNSFVDDLFNGSFDEFSPTPDQGTRSDGFSSSGDIQLPCHSTTPDEHQHQHQHQHLVGFDFMKMSQNPFIAPQRSSNPGNMGFKWPESEGGMIDINRSAKAEGDDVDIETKINVGNGNYIPSVAPVHSGISYGGGIVHPSEFKSGELMQAPKTGGARMVTKAFPVREEEEGEFIQPEAPQPPLLPPPLTLGLDPFDPRELDSDKYSHSGRQGNRSGNIEWEQSQNQRRYGGGAGGSGGGERYNSSGRDHHDEDTGYSRSSRSSWNKQSILGSGGASGGGGGGGSGGGGYSRPQSKGQRVCRFYESGRCKKGASCKYLHP